MVNKKKIILIISLIVLLSGGLYYFYFHRNKQTTETPAIEIPLTETSTTTAGQTQETHSACLADDEYVDYPLDPKYSPRIKWPKLPLVIYVRNKDTNKEISHFQIDNVTDITYPLEIRKCNVYVIREINYDPKKTKQDPGYKEELWRYDYSGKGEVLLLLAEKQKEFISYYDPDFQVDPQEVYVALIRGGYLERPDYALVIRNFNTQTDDFILPRQTLFETYPTLLGIFGLAVWTKNGSHFWADLFDGANTIAFLRILRNTWKLDVLPTPTALGGAALNDEYGYFTYNTGPGWIGVDVVAKKVYDEWRKQGKIVELHLYNLFTKKDILLATSTEPSWTGEPRWLSDTELEYTLPNGEKKMFKINN